MNKAEMIANKHWDYVSKVLEQQYKTAFIHGYKHGMEELKKEAGTDYVPEPEEDGELTVYESGTGRFLVDEKAMED